jgi:hypothetical protein
VTGDAEDHLARLRSIVDGLEREARHSAAERADFEANRAEEARAGRLGPDWQAVQRRIDDGQTTLADVFAGRDGSPEATRLLGLSRQNLSQLAVDLEPPPEVAADLEAAEAEWAALMRQARTGGQQ